MWPSFHHHSPSFNHLSRQVIPMYTKISDVHRNSDSSCAEAMRDLCVCVSRRWRELRGRGPKSGCSVILVFGRLVTIIVLMLSYHPFLLPINQPGSTINYPFSTTIKGHWTGIEPLPSPNMIPHVWSFKPTGHFADRQAVPSRQPRHESMCLFFLARCKVLPTSQ